MNRGEIEKILPHRSSMLLLDSAELQDGVARAKKHITGNEFFLDGHFPGAPVVPGVILCEILAQSACVLLADAAAGDVTTLLTGLDQVKFRRVVRPGDTVETECRITANKGFYYRAEGKVCVDGQLCMSAQFSFAVMKKEGA